MIWTSERKDKQMLIQNETIPAMINSELSTFKYRGKDIIEDSIFFDLEHYLYKEPIAIGVFGAAVYHSEEKSIKTTQYMIENKRDARVILSMTKDYFTQMKRDGKKYLVTFSGNNDFLVVNHLFRKYEIDYNFEEEFQLVDIQKEYEMKFKKNIGLKNLEKLHHIERYGELISGMTLAKTFSKIIKDRGYIERMPKDKISRILKYNEQDVVNLFNIMNQWEDVTIEDVMVLEEKLLKEKLEKLEMKRLLQEEMDRNSETQVRLDDMAGEMG